jgi:hypothetical protein
MAENEEEARRRAERLRKEVERLRSGQRGEPSSPREFVEREAQREEERLRGSEEPSEPPTREDRGEEDEARD